MMYLCDTIISEQKTRLNPDLPIENLAIKPVLP